MNWIELNKTDQLDVIDRESENEKILIFKHSTRCSISDTALSRLERNWPDESSHKIYLLDLLAHRDISDRIAEKFSTVHQSPQVLIIKNGKCVYTRSHFEINASEILNELS